MSRLQLVGREGELAVLREHLESAKCSGGNTLLVSGEPGMGKTTLVQEFVGSVSDNARVITGSALSESSQPFHIFSRALTGLTSRPLFEENEFHTFTELFAIDRAGILVGKAAPEEGGLDADIFAGMFAAVQDFVSDSFDRDGDARGTLGRLEYGNMKIIIEHGQYIFLVAVFRGAEHPDMKQLVRRTLDTIEDKYGTILEGWKGNTEETAGVQAEIESLAQSRFLVRKSLQGISLDQERTRISEEVLGTLVELEQDGPILLLLEDLHWADESSIFVLNYLARNVRSFGIFILGTLRPREGRSVIEKLEGLISEEAVSVLDLGKFDLGNVKSLISGLYPNHRLPDKFIESITSQSGGNPFFTTELLRSLEVNGNIFLKDGKYFLDEEDFTLPSSIEEVVHRRIEVLDRDSLAIVEYAACIGREFDQGILFASKSFKEPESTLEMLKGMGIIAAMDGVHQFTHAMFHSVLYDSLSYRWKMLHHKEIGEWYEFHYAGRPDEVIYELARHFSNTKEYQKCYDYCRVAGEKAEGAFSPDLATSFYKSAIEVIPLLRLGADAGVQEFQLQERLGEIKGLQGHFDESLENYSAALAVAPDEVSRARIHRRMAYVMTMHGQFDNALAELDIAEKLLEGKEHDEKGIILISRSFVNLNTGHFDDTLKVAKEGIQILQGSDDADAKKMEGMAWKIMGVVHLLRGEFEDSLRTHGEGKRIGEELNDPYGLSAAYNNIGNVYLAQGSFDKALEYYEVALDLLEKTKDLQGKSYTLNNVGIINKNMGNYEKAMEYYDECLQIMEKTGDPSGMASSLNNIGIIYDEQGKDQEALDTYLRALDIARRIGDKQQTANNLCSIIPSRIRLGMIAEAERDWEEAMDISKELGSKRNEYWAIRNKGIILARQGKVEDAIERFSASARGFKELGMEAEVAKTMYEHGKLLMKGDDIEEGRKLIQDAMDVFSNAGMQKLVENCSKLLAGK